MNNIVIGLDCGATHSTLAVWREGVKIEEDHNLPGANLDLINSKEMRDSFILEFDKLKAYGESNWIVGMAGVDDQRELFESEEWFRAVLNEALPYSGLWLMSDIDLVLWAGSDEGVGVAIIAGTGSNCLGKNRLGLSKKVGGMSHLMSDEGSAFMLGWKCLHLVTKMADDRLAKTSLLNEVLRFFDSSTITNLKNFLLKQENQKAVIASCAPLLLLAAERGEVEAGRIVAEESAELVRMVITTNTYLETDELPVFLAGSLFKRSSYMDQFVMNLHHYFPKQKVVRVVPIDGAIKYYNHLSAQKNI